MFTTSIPLSPAYVRASTLGCRKKYPESWPALRFTRVTFGAMPSIPRPFVAAAIVPATCVPWLFSSTSAGSEHDWSGSSAQGPSTSSMSVVKLRDSAASKFGAMSGCEPSMPVSMTPTRTPLRPGCTLCDSYFVAWIMAMSHWRGARGSKSPPGVASSSWAPPLSASRNFEELRSDCSRSSMNL